MEDNIKGNQAWVQALIRGCLNNPYIRKDLEFLHKKNEVDKGQEQGSYMKKLEKWANEPFEVILHEEAVKLLQKQGDDAFKTAPKADDDLNAEHERFLTKHFDKPVFVTGYPKRVKAFYMPLMKDSTDRVQNFDLLVPGIGELIGGSQRISDAKELLARMEEMKVPLAGLEWYVDLRRFGTMPHGGSGMGFERMVLLLTGLHNIRDAVPFIRCVGSCEH